MEIYERVIELCSQFNVEKTTLERACGFSQNSINKWQKSVPSIDKILKIADYFGVSVDYLLGRDIPSSIIKHQSTDLTEKYQYLFDDEDFMKLAAVYAAAQDIRVKGLLVGYFIAAAKANGVDTSIIGY